MRRLIAFSCTGETLVGTLDVGAGATGLLIVSGGNEVRSGAHRGMALLAARLAASGTSVFRYDRRGIGDSSGTNGGYEAACDDLVAAAGAFRLHAPHVDRIVGFGNCDAAATLALFGRDAGIDMIVVANPWIGKEDDTLPPAAAIRRRYRDRLRDPAVWWKAATGGIDLRKLFHGLRKIARTPSQRGQDAERVIAALDRWGPDIRIVLAQGDATAIAYTDAANRTGLAVATTIIPTASHSFARAGDADALEAAIRAAL